MADITQVQIGTSVYDINDAVARSWKPTYQNIKITGRTAAISASTATKIGTFSSSPTIDTARFYIFHYGYHLGHVAVVSNHTPLSYIYKIGLFSNSASLNADSFNSVLVCHTATPYASNAVCCDTITTVLNGSADQLQNPVYAIWSKSGFVAYSDGGHGNGYNLCLGFIRG